MSFDNVSRLGMLLQVGYLSSWSAYNTFKAKQNNQPDPIKQFAEDFAAKTKLSSVHDAFDVSFPIFLLICNNRS